MLRDLSLSEVDDLQCCVKVGTPFSVFHVEGIEGAQKDQKCFLCRYGCIFYHKFNLLIIPRIVLLATQRHGCGNGTSLGVSPSCKQT